MKLRKIVFKMLKFHLRLWCRPDNAPGNLRRSPRRPSQLGRRNPFSFPFLYPTLASFRSPPLSFTKRDANKLDISARTLILTTPINIHADKGTRAAFLTCEVTLSIRTIAAVIFAAHACSASNSVNGSNANFCARTAKRPVLACDV